MEIMEHPRKLTFRKPERLCSRKLIEALFAGGNKSMSSYPLRTVYMTLPPDPTSPARVSIMVSVSKRRFKRAVKRNRVKRQVREAYRKNKALLGQALDQRPDTRLAIAFLWLSDRLYSSTEVERCVRRLLARIAEQTYPRANSTQPDEPNA